MMVDFKMLISVLSAILLSTTHLIDAQFRCICNINPKLTIEVFDTTHTSIGYIYPNGCVPITESAITDEGWLAVTFEQSTAFVNENVYGMKTYCPEENSDDVGTSELPVIGMSTPSATVATAEPGATNPPSGQTTTNAQSIIANQGDTSLCPPYMVQGATANGYPLAQRGHHCYEFCPHNVSWSHANLLCTQRGGHLVSIHSDTENNYLHKWLKDFGHQIWIGMNDRDHEEHFKWTTGERATYTNWQSHRKGQNHNHEDCVVLQPGGHWDDIECGGDDIKSEHDQMQRAYICEYELPNDGSFVVG